jgi:hypothetical protein
MVLIDNAKKLLDECQRTENALFDVVSYHSCSNDIAPVQYLAKRIPELIEECREICRHLVADDAETEMFMLRHYLRRMTLRLEAAIMYAKEHVSFN